jgi:hypothetical protein
MEKREWQVATRKAPKDIAANLFKLAHLKKEPLWRSSQIETGSEVLVTSQQA